MKQYRDQAGKDHKAKLGKFAQGGGMHHPDPMMGMPRMGGKANGGHSDVKEDKAVVRKMVKPEALTGHAKGGKATHKPHKKHPDKGPSAQELLARPVPASGAMAAPVSARPVQPASSGLAPMMGALKHGGRAHRADGGRTTHHHMTAGAESGVGRLQKIGKKP